MHGRFKTILFDLDGTLADTLQDVGDAINHALYRMGRPAMPPERIRRAVGPGREAFIQQVFPGVKNPDYEAFIGLFRAFYWDHCLDRTRLFEGMGTVLERIGDLKLGIASNKPKRFSEKILKGLGIRKRFQLVLGPGDVKKAKPHPEMILKSVEALGGSIETTLFIGDTEPDMQAGQDARVRVCAVRYGYGDWDEVMKRNPDYAAETAAEIVEIVCNHIPVE